MNIGGAPIVFLRRQMFEAAFSAACGPSDCPNVTGSFECDRGKNCSWGLGKNQKILYKWIRYKNLQYIIGICFCLLLWDDHEKNHWEYFGIIIIHCRNSVLNQPVFHGMPGWVRQWISLSSLQMDGPVHLSQLSLVEKSSVHGLSFISGLQPNKH